MSAPTKRLLVPMMVKAIKVGSLFVHGAVGRCGWTVTARSGFSATGGHSFETRDAAEQYARALSRLADWSKHPLEEAKAFAWAKRLAARRRRALDSAFRRATQLDAKTRAP